MDGAPEAPAATTDADYGRVRRFKPQTTTLTRYSPLSLFSLYDFYRLSSISNGVDNAVIDLVLSTFKPELDPALRLTLYWPSPGISGFIIGFCWCNWTRVVTVTDALLPRSRPSLLAPLLCSRVLLSSCFRFDSPLRRSVYLPSTARRVPPPPPPPLLIHRPCPRFGSLTSDVDVVKRSRTLFNAL